MSKIIIIGASHSGISLADLLRKNGSKDEIYIIDSSMELPVERPPLSKSFITNFKPNNTKSYLLRSLDWYKKNNIYLKLGISVEKILKEQNKIILSDGSDLTYNNLAIATGATPNLLPERICSSENLLVLRSFEDANKIANSIKKNNSVTIIGGGYIGLELASSLTSLGCKVTIVEMAKRLLARVASREISEYFYELHLSKGVSIKLNTNIEKVEEKDNKFHIFTANKKELISNNLILGIGVHPQISLAKSASIFCEDGIIVDSSCRTSEENIYAIGDCCLIKNETSTRIESIHNANNTALRACFSILGKDLPKYEASWFWSDQYDVKFQSVGFLPQNYKTYFREGRREGSKSFWSFEENNLTYVETINDPQSFMIAKKILENNIKLIDVGKVTDKEFNLKSIIKN